MEFLNIQLLLKQDIAHTLSYLGAIQGLILAIIVWNFPAQHKVSNRILSLFIFSFVHLLVVLRIFQEFDFPYMRLILGIRTLAPIALFLYIQSLYKEINWKKQYWHVFVLLMDLAFIYGIPEIQNSSFGNLIDWSYISFGWFILIYSFYFYLSYKALRQYRKRIFQNFSDLQRIKLRWVTQVYFIYLGLIVVGIILGFISIGFRDAYRPYAGMFTSVSYTLFMYFISIKGKLTPAVYNLRELDKHKPPLAEKNNELLEHKTELKVLSLQIIKMIEEKKMFKEMGLSVNEVAEQMGEQPYMVSQAINSCLGKNFFELINGYRVEEAKNLLLDESWDYLSIVGIGFEAGFNSKTTFNTSFKKFTGVTPSQFKKTR